MPPFFDVALPRLSRFLLCSSKPQSFVNINKILFRSNYTGLGYLFCDFYGFFRDDNGMQFCRREVNADQGEVIIVEKIKTECKIETKIRTTELVLYVYTAKKRASGVAAAAVDEGKILFSAARGGKEGVVVVRPVMQKRVVGDGAK